MAFENISNNAKELYADIQDIVKSNLEYYKLDLLKKSAKGTIKITTAVVLASVFFFFLLFISLAAGFLISEEIGSLGWGFLIVAGFYLLLLILAYIFCKTKLEKIVLNKFSEKFYKDPEA